MGRYGVGATWSATATITTVSTHRVAGSLRSGPLPSAEIDGAGKVYMAWQDCRFRRGCPSNDIVMTTSSDGATWSAVQRVPIDAVTSKAEYFIPGLAVDRSSSGSTARLALAYYFYPIAKCSSSTCQLSVGFISSQNGGGAWSAATQLAGPMSLAWLPSTSQGVMVGDYISTSFAGGTAHPFFVNAQAKSGTTFNQALVTPSTGISVAVAAAAPSGLDQAVFSSADHAAAPSILRRQ